MLGSAMTCSSVSLKRIAGFTIIEMAVALFVIALLLGSLLVPLTTQVEERQVSEAEKRLEEIRDALIGFAVINGYLPCPDRTTGASSNDGAEDIVNGFCNPLTGALAIGNVPWATLGLTNTTDAWGNRYRYAVIENFARRTPQSTFSLTTVVADALRICTTTACTTQVITASTSSAVAIILSHGRNGWGAISAFSNAANTASTSADEIENSDSDSDYVYRTRTALGATVGEFDDILTWVSRSVLLHRMVAAGKLP
jgi:type II secretory pathway pseudopilin PulG